LRDAARKQIGPILQLVDEHGAAKDRLLAEHSSVTVHSQARYSISGSHIPEEISNTKH